MRDKGYFNILNFNFIKYFFIFLILASCNFLNDEKSIVIGVSSDQPPEVFMENGVMKGYVVDLIEALGDVGGFKFEIRDMNTSSLLNSLSGGMTDIIPCLVITKERKKNIDFSEIYDWDRGFVIVHDKGNVLPDLASLKGKKVAVPLATAMERFIEEKNLEMSLNLNIYRYDSINITLESLKSKKVDAVIIAHANASAAIDNDLSFSEIGGNIEVAFGFKKGRKDGLPEKINSAIKSLKKSGELYKLRSKWYD